MSNARTSPSAHFVEACHAGALMASGNCADGCAALAPETFALHPPDVHLMRRQSTPHEPLTARCSLWWTEAPTLEGERLGLIGHYAAVSERAGTALLSAAVRQLRQAGCTRAAGPMDGATWRPYRFVIGGAAPSEAPPFFLEPDHPAAYVRHFRRAGFAPWIRYRSARVSLAPLGDFQPMADGPWSLRALCPAAFDDELRRLYQIAADSFKESALYTPLPEAVFLKTYRALRPHVDPDLVRIAERDGQPVGFCFALPDHRQRKRGAPVDTVVLKTLAVHPEARRHGLGARLAADVHRVVREKGYRHIVHALMRSGNPSNDISNAYPDVRTLRRYALFSKTIGA